jgi:mannose-6-phosphate isomerase-like protein (cupin superfamily)
MKHANLASVLTVSIGVTTSVPLHAADPPARPAVAAAPAPGSPGTYVNHDGVDSRLAAATAAAKDPAVSSVAVTDQYSISKVHRSKAGAPPAIHPGWTELHLVLEGGATFVTGGQIVTPAGAAGGVIEGGSSQAITKGDAVIVPQNTPHWYKDIDAGGITVVEVRFIAPPPAAAPQSVGK